MNFKRILVLVLTFAMLLSTFAPTLGVFAENLNNDAHEHESNEKHYVSIGDSMANGYGFDGYEQGEYGHDFYNGVGTYGAGAYPLQFEEYLRDQGYYVTHTKLAVSALRAEDLLYLLGGRDEPADDWFEQVLNYAGTETQSGSNIYANVGELSQYYQNAVKDADIITLGVGNASFGAFFLSRVTAMLGVMGGSLTETQKAMYTLENALALLENEDDKEMILELYDNVYAKINDYVDASIAEQYKLENVCNLLAYTAAGFILNFAKSLEKIDELNEKKNLELVLVGLMNTTYGMTIDLGDGEKFYFGDVMDEVFALLNDYIVLYPTLKQAEGKFESITFHYAEQPQPKFIVQAFDDLAYAGWTNIDCGEDDCGEEGHVCAEGAGRLSADIVRARTIKTYNESLRIMIANAMFAENVAQFGVDAVLPPLTLDNVKAWKSWDEIKTLAGIPDGHPEYDNPRNAFGLMHDNSALTTSVAIYLGIEDAIVNSIAVDDIPLEGVLTIADMNKLLGVFDGLGDISASPYTVRDGLGAHLSKDHILPLCKIYAIFNIGDGMCVHPTPAGHDDLSEVIVEAYEYEDGIPAGLVLDKMNHVWGYANEYGLIGEVPALAVVEEIYEYLDTQKYIKDEQTLDIILYSYVRLNDNTLSDKETTEIAQHAYETLVRNPLLTASQRVEIVGNVYSILKSNDYFNEYTALEVVEDLYAALDKEALISDEQSYAIVDYIYEAIADGEFSDEDEKDTFAFIYETLVLYSESVENSVAVLGTVYSVLKENGYLDEYSSALEVVEEIYAALDEKGLISDVQSLIIVDYLYTSVMNDNVDLFDTVIFIYNVLVKNRLPIAVYTMSAEEETSPEALRIIIGVLAENYLNEENKKSVEKLITGEGALINDELLIKVVDNAIADIENSESVDQAVLVEKISANAIQTVLDDPNTDPAVKTAIVDEIKNVADNNQILDDETSGAYDEAVALVGKIYENLNAEGLMGEEEKDQLINILIYSVVLPYLNGEEITTNDAIAIVVDVVDVIFGRDDLTNEQRIDIFVVVYETLDEEGYITKENAEIVLDFILEYYDEAYEYGYAYADEEGYIDVAVSVLEKVVARLELVDLSDNGPMTEEFKAELQKEIDALIETLKEIKDVLANDSAKDVEGLVKVILALEDDLYTHLENIYALCAQAGIDVTELVIIPALKEALYIIETELIPALKELVNEFVDAVIAYVTEKAEELYNAALGLSKEVYLELVALAVRVQLYVGELVDTVLNQYFALVEKLEAIYGDVYTAYEKALEIFNGLVEKALEVKKNVEDVITYVVTTYPVLVEKLYEALGDMNATLETANKVIAYAISRVANVVTDVNDIAVLLNDIVTIVYEILVDAGLPVDEALELAVEVAKEALEMHLEEMGVENALDVANILLEKTYEYLLEKGLTVKEALVLSAQAFAGLVVVIIENFDDIDNALDLTKEVLQTVYDFLVENRVEITEALRIAVDVTKTVVEYAIEAVDTVEKALEIVANAYDYILEVAAKVYETAEEIYAFATEVYVELVKVVIKVHGFVDATIDVYNFVYDLLVDIFDRVENAGRIAFKLATLIVEFIKNNPEIIENAYKLYVDIYNIIVEVYGETGDACEAAKAVYAYALNVAIAVKENVAELIYNASNADYEITLDSYYVALGNAGYAEELANMLFLGNKYAQFGLSEDYLADLAKADLVTVKFNNGEFMEFASTQIKGKLAEIITGNKNLNNIYNTLESWGVTATFEESLGFTLDCQAVELDWSKYLDADSDRILHNTLAKMKANLLANGAPEYVDIAPSLNTILENINIPLILEGNIDVPVIDLVMFGIESALYAYVETIDRVATTLDVIHSVAPNATVVITCVDNPIAGFVPMLDAYSEYIGNVAQYLDYADVVVDVVNANMYAFALVQENTIFVNSDDAEDIYAALHAHCAHAYDDCVDTVCNICGEERVAPGHSFTNYVFNNNAACGKNGTETAKCDNCDETHTREAEGTALSHNWGDWVTVKEATTEEEGLKEQTCKLCGAKNQEIIDKLPITPEKTGLPTWAIVLISVGSVAVACGAGALVYFFIKRKKQA